MLIHLSTIYESVHIVTAESYLWERPHGFYNWSSYYLALCRKSVLFAEIRLYWPYKRCVVILSLEQFKVRMYIFRNFGKIHLV